MLPLLLSCMDKAEVISILKQLANGRDPRDGQYFPTDRKTVQALSYAIGVLEHLTEQAPAFKKPAGSRRSPLPRNAGKPWNEIEDLLLTTEFDNGMRIDAIATKHGRTPLSISSRLVKLGKLAPESLPLESTPSH